MGSGNITAPHFVATDFLFRTVNPLRTAKMTRHAIETATAYRMRFHCGLMLPPDREYLDPRLQEIAKQQAILQQQLDILDEKLAEIAKQCCEPHELEYDKP